MSEISAPIFGDRGLIFIGFKVRSDRDNYGKQNLDRIFFLISLSVPS